MRNKKIRFLGLLTSILFLFSSITAASAVEARASYYFGCTEVLATATGSGKVLVEVDIDATHTMQELGATNIEIWEKQTSGSYKKVKTYTRYNTSNLIETDTPFSFCSVTYQGKSGTKYYAVATLYAKNSSGSETMYQSSNTVTA